MRDTLKLEIPRGVTYEELVAENDRLRLVITQTVEHWRGRAGDTEWYARLERALVKTGRG